MTIFKSRTQYGKVRTLPLFACESRLKFVRKKFSISISIILTSHHFSDWSPGMHVPLDITALYVVVFAFYLHSVYATLYIDRWRKDSLVMLFHHFLTMSLVGFSYGAR